MVPSEKAKEFLKIAPQFKLGHLVTESFHPKTTRLSFIAEESVEAAHALLQEVDRDALTIMRSKEGDLWALAEAIKQTLSNGHRIYMCGCGATGRLSLVLETLYRQLHSGEDRVFSFMAGGDFALIKSVESFEDRTEYGEKQLMELGFRNGDLLLASTEGGETPFVIGAANKAAFVSENKPFFLYCNPDNVLEPIHRSREVIQNKNIHKINLTVGAMSISGSTRMQASTVLMLAIGVGLLHRHRNEIEFGTFYQNYLSRLMETDYSIMAPFTSAEAEVYRKKTYVNYVTDPFLGISILTDTTERSPTFSLRAFENRLDPNHEHGLCYLFLPEAETSEHAWTELLWRKPRPLHWDELDGKISHERVLGFDISGQGEVHRSKIIPTKSFSVFYQKDTVTFKFQGHELNLKWGSDPLFNHLMVKMLLNAHSTLIMGLLGRYQGNVMTWVRPSNNKLIDRAARYIQQLAKQAGKSATYETVVEKIFEEIEIVNEDEPVVLRVLEKL